MLKKVQSMSSVSTLRLSTLGQVLKSQPGDTFMRSAKLTRFPWPNTRKTPLANQGSGTCTRLCGSNAVLTTERRFNGS